MNRFYTGLAGVALSFASAAVALAMGYSTEGSRTRNIRDSAIRDDVAPAPVDVSTNAEIGGRRDPAIPMTPEMRAMQEGVPLPQPRSGTIDPNPPTAPDQSGGAVAWSEFRATGVVTGQPAPVQGQPSGAAGVGASSTVVSPGDDRRPEPDAGSRGVGVNVDVDVPRATPAQPGVPGFTPAPLPYNRDLPPGYVPVPAPAPAPGQGDATPPRSTESPTTPASGRGGGAPGPASGAGGSATGPASGAGR